MLSGLLPVSSSEISLARKIADYATRHCDFRSVSDRSDNSHLGSVMADAILQSGLNYRTVVYPRIVAILEKYPEAEFLCGVNDIIKNSQLPQFLRWKHETKLQRFRDLAKFFKYHEVETTSILKEKITSPEFRSGLLNLNGIGPKTVDYIASLVGIDTVCIDRHLRSFASKAGVTTMDYDSLVVIFSYAADLLGISRSHFDSLIWQYGTLKLGKMMLCPICRLQNNNNDNEVSISKEVITPECLKHGLYYKTENDSFCFSELEVMFRGGRFRVLTVSGEILLLESGFGTRHPLRCYASFQECVEIRLLKRSTGIMIDPESGHVSL